MNTDEFDNVVPAAPSPENEAPVIANDVDLPASEVDQLPTPPPAPVAPAPSVEVVQAEVRPSEVPANLDMGQIKDASTGGINLTPEAQITKDKLSKQRKVPIIVPLEFGEKPGAVKIVNINGYQFEIKKNVYVEVPEAVANLIMKTQRQSVEARANNPRNLANVDDTAKRRALNI